MTEETQNASAEQEEITITTSEELPAEEDQSGTSEEETQEETSEEGEEEGSEEEQEEELSEADLKRAKDTFKLLNNSETAIPFLKALAEQAGILKPTATPSQVTKTIKDLVKEELGEDYSMLSDKLGNLLEKIETQRRSEQAQLVKTVEAKDLEREVESAFNSLVKETNGDSKKHEARILELMDEILPGPKQSTKGYLKHLYTIASSEKKEGTIRKKMAEKIQKNAQSVSRLGDGSAGGSGNVRQNQLAQAKGVGAAVERAMRQLRNR